VRHVRMLALCIIGALALTAFASSSAWASNPTKTLSIFKNCPTPEEEAGFYYTCVFARTNVGEGGEYTVGSITVPIKHQIVLQYGIKELEENEAEESLLPTDGVPAIKPAAETVPGEPIAHISATEQEELGWSQGLKEAYDSARPGKLKKVTESIELAGIPATDRGNLLRQEGTAVEAPVKIKGENAFLTELGDTCYIGSNEDPIVQHLTSGESTSPKTGETISGKLENIHIYHEGQDVAIGSTLVDNTYPVPAASCTGPFSTEVAATLNKIFGLPAEAGASETILHGWLYNAKTSLVVEHGF
jgi:hypothetical protein